MTSQLWSDVLWKSIVMTHKIMSDMWSYNEPNPKLRHKQKMATLVGGLSWFLNGRPLDKNYWPIVYFFVIYMIATFSKRAQIRCSYTVVAKWVENSDLKGLVFLSPCIEGKLANKFFWWSGYPQLAWSYSLPLKSSDDGAIIIITFSVYADRCSYIALAATPADFSPMTWPAMISL